MKSAPPETKFKKYHKQKIRLTSSLRHNKKTNLGEFGLRAIESGRLAKRHLEALRRTIRRYVKKSGKIWFVGGALYPVTAKPQEIRMGKGKGNTAYWVRPTRAGSLVVSFRGPNLANAARVLRAAAKKLPVRSVFDWEPNTLHN